MSYLLNYNPGTPQYTYPRRGGAKLSGTAIIHTAECGMDLDGDDQSAEICASFIANRADYGSYHRLVDSDSIVDMLPWEYEAWQDSETNNWAVGISAAVQAGNWHIIPAARRDRIYRNMAACAADFVRHMAGKGITVPLVRITGAQARNRVPGFCAHGDSGLHRSDPGALFDWALFFNYTAQALSGGITAQGSTSQEDELSAEFERDVRAQLESDAAKFAALDRDLRAQLDGLPALDRDLRADLAQKGQQITALTSTTEALAGLVGHEQGLDIEQIKQAVTEAIAAGLTITVEAGK